LSKRPSLSGFGKQSIFVALDFFRLCFASLKPAYFFKGSSSHGRGLSAEFDLSVLATIRNSVSSTYCSRLHLSRFWGVRIQTLMKGSEPIQSYENADHNSESFSTDLLLRIFRRAAGGQI
jgi:hypothetical protein